MFAVEVDWFKTAEDSWREFKERVVFIMDNAGVHSTDEVVTYFKNWQFMCLTTPQYSPQFNPIELMFGLTKNILRRRMNPLE